MMTQYLLTLMLFGALETASALPRPIALQPGKISAPIASGVLTGGRADEEFTLLKITREAARGGIEKWTILYGDRQGKPIQQQPGYYHLTVDRNSRRLVLDLAQVYKTAVDRKQLEKMTKASTVVAASEMVMDPQDRSTNLTLNMKSAVEVRVSAEESDEGKLVLLMKPVLPTKAVK